MQAITRHWFESYWGRTGVTDAVAGYIQMNYEGLKDDILKMLAGSRCKVNPSGFNNDLSQILSRDDVLTVLIHLGYLSYDRRTKECQIPNLEVFGEMENAIKTNKWKLPSYGLKNQGIYQLTDNFTLFHLKFISKNENNDEQFWSHNYMSPLHNTWVGLAFEQVCFQHIRQIKSALGISGVATSIYAWHTKASSKDAPSGAQIDMLIDRADNMVNVCEMKYSKKDYRFTSEDARTMANKIELFSAKIGHKKSINLTMITVYGLEHSGHWNDIHQTITADDLFKE